MQTSFARYALVGQTTPSVSCADSSLGEGAYKALISEEGGVRSTTGGVIKIKALLFKNNSFSPKGTRHKGEPMEQRGFVVTKLHHAKVNKILICAIHFLKFCNIACKNICYNNIKPQNKFI